MIAVIHAINLHRDTTELHKRETNTRDLVEGMPICIWDTAGGKQNLGSGKVTFLTIPSSYSYLEVQKSNIS